MASLRFLLLGLVGLTFVVATNSQFLEPPTHCGHLGGFMTGSLHESYTNVVGESMYHYCPAHSVNNWNFKRRGAHNFCGVVVNIPIELSNNCTDNSTNTTDPSSTTAAPTTTANPVTCDIVMSNDTYSPAWWTYGSACEPATCLPKCENGGTCYCGLVCRCDCPSPYTGADCSIDSTTISNFASAKVLYAMADPHWILQPDKSNKPWVMDLTGNGLHGEINGYVGLDNTAGPDSRTHSAFVFGLNPLQPGYISIDHSSYNLSQVGLVDNFSGLTVMALYKPGGIADNETTIYHIARAGGAPGFIVSTSLSATTFYYDTDLGYSQDTCVNPVALATSKYKILRYEFTASREGVHVDDMSTSNFALSRTMLLPATQGFYIGKHTNSGGTAEPPEDLFGKMSSFIINDNIGLGMAHSNAHQSFTTANYGTGTPPIISDEVYTPCPVSPAQSAMGTDIIVNATIGDSIDYICPPFYTHYQWVPDPDTPGKLIIGYGERVDTSICSASGWNSTTFCISDPAPPACDPICINGGTCMCTLTACSCQCWPGFTGPDCFAPTSAIPSGYLAFWPITQETLGTSGGGNLEALDFSGNGQSIAVEKMGFDTGPWGTVNTAVRQHYLQGRSHMSLASPFVLPTASDFTILFYLRLPHTPLSLPNRVLQPLFLYSSPTGSAVNNATGFFLDESSGSIKYYPGDIELPLEGLPFTTTPGSWVPVKIAYQASDSFIGTASWDSTPVPGDPSITISASPTATFYIGYNDVSDLVGDMSVACVGIYNKTYTDQLAWDHGRVCQMLSKLQCTSAPHPDTTAVKSGSTLYSAGVITYTCFNGMIWNTTGNMTTSFGCNPNESMLPTLDWDEPSVPGVCITDPGVCHPPCLNGGVCNGASPAECVCPSTHIGLDCSIPKNIFPSSCNLVSFWPLNTIHITKDGYAADIWGPNSASVNTSTIVFPDNIGPFVPSGMGVAKFTDSVPGTVQVLPSTSPFPSGSSFVVSAFIRFDDTAGTAETDLYPMIAFTNRGVTNSPAIYISPMGNASIIYKSAKTAYNYKFDAGGMRIGISATWAFVTVMYNSLNNRISMSVNASVFGASVTLNPTPMFSTANMYIGSVDTGIVWPGQITCLSIYNWVLTTGQLAEMMAACEQVLGGATAPAVSPNCNACSGLLMPKNTFAMPSRNDVVAPYNTVITYRSQPFTKFPGTTLDRTTTSVCLNTGQWSNLTDPDITSTGLITCDPPCMNNGLCECSLVTCYCVCPAGTTGSDCGIFSVDLPGNMVGFWPLTKDTISYDVTLNSTLALDFSGNTENLAVGRGVGIETGYFGGYSAFRFRNGQENSFLSSLGDFVIANTVPTTIMFYMKYNPSSDDQPLLAYSSTATQNTEFWIDQGSGLIKYYPDNVLLNLTGTDLGTNPGTWLPVVISHSPTPSVTIGTATANSDPADKTSTTPLKTTSTLFVGYSDFPISYTSDVSVSCLGIYSAAFSTALAEQHGQACHIFAKRQCSTPAATPTYSYRTANQADTKTTVSYYCWNGYYFVSNGLQRFSTTCQQSASTITPSISWNGTPAGACVANTTDCIPACANGGTCVAGTPTATCTCSTGFAGVDCSIDLSKLPFFCKLSNLWPLTATQIDNQGLGIDIGNLQQPLTFYASIRWPDQFGPYIGIQQGVADFDSGAPVGGASRTMTAAPFLSTTSFTISAYIRFSESATYTTLYPMVAFTNVWTTASPAIFISPDGQLLMNYKYADSSYTVSFSAARFIGLQPWAFISVRYDASTSNIDAIMNGNLTSTAVALEVNPMFSTDVVYLGSSDVTPAGGSNILEGQLACVSIYSEALDAAELLQLKLACDTILGGPVASASVTPVCRTCSSPPSGGITMPSISDLTYQPGTVATYVTPRHTRFSVANLYRTMTTSCSAGSLTWSNSIPTINTTAAPPVLCDPECKNGGLCQCDGTNCQCVCTAAFTGSDCVSLLSLMPASTKAFWPLTADTTRPDSGVLQATDISGSDLHLTIGSGVTTEDGPFSGTLKHGFRFRSQTSDSNLQLLGAQLALPASFTVLMYVKYNSKNAGHQPLLSWASTDSKIQISSATGMLTYSPGSTAVVINGSNFTSSPDTWIPLAISYDATAVELAASTFDETPSITATLGAPPSTTLAFSIGMSDTANSDLSVACVGVYDGEVFSVTRAQNHGMLCQRLAKPQCASAPTPPSMSNAFSSNPSGVSFIGESIAYSCVGGHEWNTTGSQIQTVTCSQTATSNLLPTKGWSSPSLSGLCTPSTTTCYPSCLNGGTCIPGTPTAVCTCATGFGGQDCSISTDMLPMRCYLQSLWPLTNNHVNNLGQAIDIMRALGGASVPLATISSPTNGPASSPTVGVFRFNITTANSVQVATPHPLQPLASFTISAFVRFEYSADLTKLYPLMGYLTSPGLTDSPALFISPTGTARFHYVAVGSAYSVDFSAAALIGLGPWAFISIKYDRANGTVDLTIMVEPSITVTGTAAVVNPPPIFVSSNPINIGSSDLVVPPDAATVMDGQIGCLSIYERVLNLAEVIALKTACLQILGGPVAVAPTQCNLCSSMPKTPLALPSKHDKLIMPGTSVTYTCPAFTRQLDPDVMRESTLVCVGNETWVPSSPIDCNVEDSPRMCHPQCLNGGSCVCQNSECSCSCPSGFTGIECLIPTGFLHSATLALWPMSFDSIIEDPSSNITSLAADLSGNGRHLSVGLAAAMDTGPFGERTAFKFRSDVTTSYLSLTPSTLPLSNTQQVTFLFYVKHSLDVVGNQPLFSFSPSGSSFWIDLLDSQVRYYPGNLLLPNNGASITSSPNNWLLAGVTFDPSTGSFGVSTSGSSISMASPATAAFTGNFYIGYAQNPTTVISDLSISCFGIYENVGLSNTLVYSHASSCQRFAKQSCSTAPTVTNAFQSDDLTSAGNSISYTCLGAGYYFNSTSSMNSQSSCVQASNSIMPSLSWSPAAINENCTLSTTDCYPACTTNGNCVAGACVCQSGYVGIDCSIKLERIPCHNDLMSFWPLTTNHLTSSGQALDIFASATTDVLSTTEMFAANNGPFKPAGSGFLRLTPSSVGSLKVESHSWPFESNSGNFLISAYVNFDLMSSYSTLYPFVSFSNGSGISGSPAIFISKSGTARMYYHSGGSMYHVNFSVPVPQVVGTSTPYSFVSIEYDWTSGNISMATLEYNTMEILYGDTVVVSPAPTFVVNSTMYIGSTDLSGLDNCGTTFPGEIACLSIYNTTMPDIQTEQLLESCWDVLGGPAADVAAQICVQLPYCPEPPHVINSTLEYIDIAPPLIGQEMVPGAYTHMSELLYICNIDHAFYNYSEVEMFAKCDWGRWTMPYPFCKEMPLQPDPYAFEVLPLLLNRTLLKYFDRINQMIVDTSYRIANLSDPEKIKTTGIVALESISATFDRFAALADNLTDSQKLQISKSSAKAASNILYALTNETQWRSAIIELERRANCSRSRGQTNEDPPTTPPVADEAELAKLYENFRKVIDTMSRLVRQTLELGTEFSMDERYFSARIRKLKLNELPALYINMSLASVTFPDGQYEKLLVEAPSLTPTTSLSIVAVAVIDNIYDMSKPFNIPTVTINVYDENLAKLTLNPELGLEIVARPLLPKAAKYSSEKVDVQCDVSEITCDLLSNADKLGSLVRFPIRLGAGHFFLNFPVDEMNYDVYIAMNEMPTPKNYTWHLHVKKNGGVTYKLGKDIFIEPSFIYDRSIGLRLVVVDTILYQFAPAASNRSSNESAFDMNVFMKRDTSGYSPVDDLPAVLCQIQRCYGYHLNVVDAAKTQQSLRKRRAATSNSSALQLDPDTSESAVKFQSSYFGDLGGDLVITPNTIEFSDIFARFSTLLADNYAVLAFMGACIVIFLIGVVIAYHFDKKDIQSWGFLPILCNRSSQKIRYYVSLQYYGVKNFELEPKVSIGFVGELCDMPFKLLEDGVRENFKGKHPANFLVTHHNTVGNIDEIELNITTEKKPPYWKPTPFSMVVDKVIVIDAYTGKKFVFPVKRRLRAGRTTTVPLACEDDVKNFRYLVSGHARGGITEGHPWLSIAQRPLPSNWTRVERLACVVSAIFMAMLVNAMFYGKENESPRVGFQIGSFLRISWFTIWTSLVGSVIVIPPTATMAFIFKKIKRRSAEKSEIPTIFNIEPKIREGENDDWQSNDDGKKTDKKKKKKPFQLPYACIVIAWFLVVACIGTSAFFITMYSLSWGRPKSLQWLTGMIMHIVQDIIVIQTIKVLIFSVINSTKLSMPDDGVDVGRMTYNSNNKKKQTELFMKTRNVLAGIIHHLLYVIIFALVINTTQNEYSYQQIKDVKTLVTVDGVKEYRGVVNDYPTVFAWLSNKVIPNFMVGNLLSQVSNIYNVINHDIVLVGPIRIRQQRISFASCQVEASVVPAYVQKYAEALDTSITRCQEEYQTRWGKGVSSEKRLFNLSWEKPLDDTNYNTWSYINQTGLNETAWAFRDTDEPPYSGWQASYEAGGYFVDLPLDVPSAIADLSTLANAGWLDNSTNVFVTEFTLFNGQTNLFIPVKIVFEALNAGGMSYHIRSFPLQLYQYVGAGAMLALAIQAIWILLVLSQLVKMLYSMKKQGFKKYMKDGWNILDLVHVVLALGLVALFGVRIYVIMNTISDMKTYLDKFINLDLLVLWEDVMFCLYGIVLFMALLLFFRSLSFNKYWAIFLGTLSKAKFDIASFSLVFVLITYMFASLGYCSLGLEHYEYRSLSASAMTLVQNVIGINKVFMRVIAQTPFAKLFSMSYSLIVLFLAVQLFMSIVNVTYGLVASNVEKETNWDSDLADYMATGVKDLITQKTKTDDGNGDDLNEDHDENEEEEEEEKEKKKPFKPVGEKSFGKMEEVVHRLDKLIDRKEAEAKKTGRQDRNIVSWLNSMITGREATDVGIFLWAPNESDAAQEGSSIRQHSAAVRAAYLDYLNSSSAAVNGRKQNALERGCSASEIAIQMNSAGPRVDRTSLFTTGITVSQPTKLEPYSM